MKKKLKKLTFSKQPLTLLGFILLFPLFMTLELLYFLFSCFDQETRGKYIIDKICFNEFADIENRLVAKDWIKKEAK